MSNHTSSSGAYQSGDSLYGYTPTLYVCAIFVSLFALSSIAHIGQAIYWRLWWLFPTAILAGTAELIGWSGRLWSSQNPTLLTPYLIQITTTIIAPTPLVAANFIILGKIIQRLGPQYSRLSPKLYMIIFCSCDFIALVVQSIGGANASHAAQNHLNASIGGHIMLGGIVFQLAAITIYVACAGEFLMRYLRDKPFAAKTASLAATTESSSLEKAEAPSARGTIDLGVKKMVIGLGLSTLCIFIRSVYRTIELSDGWTGRIIMTQVYFNVLDGAMITLAMITLNALHPGRLLKTV